MKQHIGSIYLILGLMSVSALSIGAGNAPVAHGAHGVAARDLLPSPTSFRIEVGRKDEALRERILVIEQSAIDAQIEARVAKALATARARKAG